jgi:hypothetical protein
VKRLALAAAAVALLVPAAPAVAGDGKTMPMAACNDGTHNAHSRVSENGQAHENIPFHHLELHCFHGM